MPNPNYFRRIRQGGGGASPAPDTYIVAAGGNVTRDGDYLVHTFTGSDTLNITQISNNNTYNSLEYLIVAGGGGGGADLLSGGGGGAGGCLIGNFTPAVSSYSLVVGAGGAATGGVGRGANGFNSTAFSLISVGGGGGAQGFTTVTPAGSGGSGGGAGALNGGSGLNGYNGTGTVGQGFDGGLAFGGPGYAASGAGGGAGAVGNNASGSQGGNGGIGISSSISGVATYYAGGGAGGSYANAPGTGGTGGGGNGSNSGAGGNGTTNLGAGGGGGKTTSAGGSGIIIVRYFSPVAPTPYLVATGGSISRDGDYLVHTFTGSDSLIVQSLSSTPAYNNLEYLLVAGGGGGGGSQGNAGGGGGAGAGGFLAGFLVPSTNTYPIVIGSGGTTSGFNDGSNGSNTTFNSLTSIGGGGGKRAGNSGNGLSGGSGGGVSYNGAGGATGGAGTAGQGNKGGDSPNQLNIPGTGGGGAGVAGGNVTTAAGALPGIGGNGLTSSITGISTYYAGGGGGGAFNDVTVQSGAIGGLGGGGNGGSGGPGTLTSPTSGTANTGGGGGGGGSNPSAGTSGASGGSGIVIVRYFSPQDQYIVASGGTITRDGNYLVHTFTGSGTLNITSAPNNAVLQYLVVAGGGGGGQYYAAGGGGAGGLFTKGVIPSVNAYPIVVGAGGSGATVAYTAGSNGSVSTFYGLTANGGGGGGGYSFPNGLNGGSGGGGGGQDAYVFTYPGGTGTAGQGNNGGAGKAASGNTGAGGGGGGATSVGADAVYTVSNGNGGTGITSSIKGFLSGYAGGGGGGGFVTIGGSATQGGGFGGVGNNTSGQNATINTGSGGGGAGGETGSSNKGGDGASGVVIVRYLSPLPIGPYTLAYSNIVTFRGGSLTENEIIYLTEFETSMGSELAQFDRFYIHGLTNNIAARTSFVNPASTIITPVNSPTFTPTLGYQGNGINQYLDTNFNPSTQGVKYTLNNASIGVYSLTNLSATQLEIGCVFGGGGNQSILDIRDTDNRFYSGINEPTTNISSANTDSRGLFVGNRFSSNSVNQLKNGVVTQTGSNASSVIPNLNTFLLCINVNTSANLFSTRQISLSFLGSSSYNQSTFYNSIQALGNRLGWFSYTTRFKAVVLSRGGSLTTAEETYLRTFETSMGSELAEFDRLWIHGLSNDVAARTSFVNPDSTIITAVNSPTFTPNVGYQGNGVNSYINTNFNTSTQSVKFTSTSGSMGVYVNTVSSIYGALLAQIDGINSNALYRFSPDSYAYLNYSGGVGSQRTDNGIGLISAYKTNLTKQYYVKRGSTSSPDSCIGSALINDSLGIFCRFYLGTPYDNFSNPKISLTFVSSGAINQGNFYNAVQALGTSIGWAV